MLGTTTDRKRCLCVFLDSCCDDTVIPFAPVCGPNIIIPPHYREQMVLDTIFPIVNPLKSRVVPFKKVSCPTFVFMNRNDQFHGVHKHCMEVD